MRAELKRCAVAAFTGLVLAFAVVSLTGCTATQVAAVSGALEAEARQLRATDHTATQAKRAAALRVYCNAVTPDMLYWPTAALDRFRATCPRPGVEASP